MKIQNTPIKLNNQNNQPQENLKGKSPSFKGMEAMDVFLRFLDTNQAWGATAVDAGCMVTPRTAVDFTRGPEAGFETLRREATSTVNDAIIGWYGFAAALLLAQGLNKEYGIKAHKLFISDEMLDISGDIYNKNAKSNNKINALFTEAFDGMRGYNPNHANADDFGYVALDKETKKEIIDKAVQEFGENGAQGSKESKKFIEAKIAESCGSRNRIKLERTIEGKKVKAVSSAEAMVENLFTAAKTFTTDSVSKTFDGKNLYDNKFINSLKKLNSKTSILGLTAVLAVAMSVQPINMYLTKKKTGKEGFVGGGEVDKTNGFKLRKLLVGGLAAVGTLASIAPITKPKQVLKEIRFKSLAPTIPQFKLIYGLTIMSRLFSARNNNELRESSIKDSLGFANWLILGGFVSKLTAGAYDKYSKFAQKGAESFVRYNEKENGKSFFSWLTKSDIVTRDEVLTNALTKAGIDVTKGGKKGAMTFKEMLIKAKEVAPVAAKQVKALNKIQLAGYLWSGLVLGVGVPKLNIAITKAAEKKKQAQLKKTESQVQR